MAVRLEDDHLVGHCLWKRYEGRKYWGIVCFKELAGSGSKTDPSKTDQPKETYYVKYTDGDVERMLPQIVKLQSGFGRIEAADWEASDAQGELRPPAELSRQGLSRSTYSQLIQTFRDVREEHGLSKTLVRPKDAPIRSRQPPSSGKDGTVPPMSSSGPAGERDDLVNGNSYYGRYGPLASTRRSSRVRESTRAGGPRRSPVRPEDDEEAGPIAEQVDMDGDVLMDEEWAGQPSSNAAAAAGGGDGKPPTRSAVFNRKQAVASRSKMDHVETYLELCATMYHGQAYSSTREAIQAQILPNEKRLRVSSASAATNSATKMTPFDLLISKYRHSHTIDLWGPKEVMIFEGAICRYGKDFHKIAKLVETKTTKECIDFYYLWKKTSRYRHWKDLRDLSDTIKNTWD
ncbi:unnamed protein product [Vitrella brassicaformis CCMP3155]|uniref:SANT domain-containing protein n=2 Tax=Vitrella brassicaformis TaxID=1169539 RepID=A0A0G4GFI2_VITBC|nr:unnamed protein product [Vitrella brassicaformis CCMP3155]|mmetsp:Transcript_5150/g.12106  ORF Transcript_5150/g.12106 Transcript_5150/m.12106 type:complete len:403 (+) Transcript_5150:256-1464(+)|eukprot:CEM28293.1 unnamed protein product [Vitrella brassicaformis CCMP3155]